MPDRTYAWIKEHPKSSMVLTIAIAIAILALMSISSFGTPSGW